MNPKMFVQPAIRISLIAAVITGILILFGVRWWVALLSVLLAAALIALAAVWAVKRQRKQFTDRLKSFNIDPQGGRINPADLRRMYNSGGQAQKDAVLIYCMANNNCPPEEAHKFFKDTSPFNAKTRQAQIKAMQEMQAQQRKGKGKGKGNRFR
ncbi:hypothetical protein [Neisseria bacilliformis]|uniref:hypothetical protein n=1 Tax=Neisseria bacilliformis TaxID=267212 RepID=UPI0028F1341D|nr:hypothetical protein [Neisseria bacilliformis]